MSKRHAFTGLTEGLSPARRKNIEGKKAELREAMSLDELRKSLGITQEEIASRLNVGQPAVAKLERRRDVKITSLRNLIEAMGGTLEINACFPEGTVAITLNEAS